MTVQHQWTILGRPAVRYVHYNRLLPTKKCRANTVAAPVHIAVTRVTPNTVAFLEKNFTSLYTYSFVSTSQPFWIACTFWGRKVWNAPNFALPTMLPRKFSNSNCWKNLASCPRRPFPACWHRMTMSAIPWLWPFARRHWSLA